MECWKITIVGGLDNLIVSLFGVVPGTQIETEVVDTHTHTQKAQVCILYTYVGGQLILSAYARRCIDVTIEMTFIPLESDREQGRCLPQSPPDLPS